MFLHKKELDTDIYYVVGELPKHCAKWKEPHIKDHVFNCEISRIGKFIDREHTVSAQRKCGARGLESGWSQGGTTRSDRIVLELQREFGRLIYKYAKCLTMV